MALTQLMAFTSAGVLVTSFALLLIVLSFNVSNINSVAVFANAQSFASGLATRLVTSPNCFAYQSNINYYDNSSANIQGGPLYTVTDTQPGVIDYNKFVSTNFLSCIQYAYFGGGTNLPAIPSSLAAFAGVSVTLVDTQNPSDLSPSGTLSLSNYPQLNFGGKFPGIEQQVAQDTQYEEYAALAASIAVSVALGIVIPCGCIGLNIVLALAGQFTPSITPQYAALAVLASENSYSESFPVEIQFSDPDGRPLYEDSGVLNVLITYGLQT